MDTTNNNENEVRFTVRMKESLYELLKESANKNKRSIAKELEYIAEQTLVQKTSKLSPKIRAIIQDLINTAEPLSEENIKEENIKF